MPVHKIPGYITCPKRNISSHIKTIITKDPYMLIQTCYRMWLKTYIPKEATYTIKLKHVKRNIPIHLQPLANPLI